jgi:hypothetical protein
MLREELGVEVYIDLQCVTNAGALTRYIQAEGSRRFGCFCRTARDILQPSVYRNVYKY